MKNLASLALPALAFAAACGKQTFLAAALLGTPPVPNPLAPSSPIPAQTAVVAYLGTIDTSNPTKIDQSQIGTVTGADASIAFHSAQQNADVVLKVKDRGDGSYELDTGSADAKAFTYEPSQQYTLVLVGGESKEAYGAKLLPAPPTTIKEFPSEKLKNWQAGQPFTVTRSDTAGEGGKLQPAFVLAMEVDPNNPGNVSLQSARYSTVPQDPTGLLKFALGADADFRQPSFTIPGSTFVKGKYYVIALLVVKYGLVSQNTFLGSTAMSASGDAGLLVVQ